MAIRIVKPYGVPGLLNASGGWSATPPGGIITFSANVTMLGTSNYTVGETFDLPDIGTFYITSTGTKTVPDGSKTNLSLACILGYKSNVGATGGLGSCVEYDAGSTVQKVLDDLCDLAGIPTFSLPGGNTIIYEPVWLNEGESAFNKIREIVTSNGCVLYSPTGSSVICSELNDFLTGLSGTISNNTLDSNTRSFPSKIPKGAIIRGVKTEIVDTPTTETVTSKKNADVIITGNNIQQYNWVTKTTTMTRNFAARTMRMVEETTSNSPLVKETRTVDSEFETAANAAASAKVPLDVSACYPIDPGRLVSREEVLEKTQESLERPCWEKFFQSLRLSEYTDNGYTPPPIGTMDEASKILEKWTYDNNIVGVDFGSPGAISKQVEEVQYHRAEYRTRALITADLSSFTLGEEPSFLDNEDLATECKDELIDDFLTTGYNELLTYEIEEIIWRKEIGSDQWVGKQTVARIFAADRLDWARSQVREFIQNAKRNKTPPQTYKDEFVDFRETLQESLLEIVPVLEIVRKGWQPEIPGDSLTKEYELYKRHYEYRENFSDGQAGLIQLNAGRFNDFNSAKASAKAIKNLEKARSKTLTVTNINELFKVGDCDSPSFSISSDGYRSTGVYLNG